jgi:hypothetical protein
MRKGTKHSPEALQKMKKPKSEEARAHMRQPKPEEMKAKLRVPHSADRKAAISRGMQESPKLKPKREQARDVVIDRTGKWHFNKPGPPISYQDRVARQEMFDFYVNGLVRGRQSWPEEYILERIKRAKGRYCGYQFDEAKIKNEYEARIKSGLQNGTLIKNGDYIDEV